LPGQLLKLALVEEGKVGAPWETLEYLERWSLKQHCSVEFSNDMEQRKYLTVGRSGLAKTNGNRR
jgi:hypothetical protein